jgi:hypothetical protein
MPHSATLVSGHTSNRSAALGRLAAGRCDTGAMGFNPYRKFVAKPADYVLVGVAVLAVIGLLAWAFLG